MKKLFAVALVMVFTLAFSTTAFAGRHGHRTVNHHQPRAVAATWHGASDYWLGHWSNQCADHGHVWHYATDYWQGHWGNFCVDHGHVWNSTGRTWHHR